MNEWSGQLRSGWLAHVCGVTSTLHLRRITPPGIEAVRLHCVFQISTFFYNGIFCPCEFLSNLAAAVLETEHQYRKGEAVCDHLYVEPGAVLLALD